MKFAGSLGIIASCLGCLSCRAGAGDQCGTANASSHCKSTTWPRVVIGFGDPSAAEFSYEFQFDDGFNTSVRNECPSGGSTDLRCDLAVYGDPAETVATIHVSQSEGGAVLLSRVVQLRPFNYCGDGIAQLIATTGDAGTPELSAVQYVTACGM